MRQLGDLNFDLENIVNYLCDRENMQSHQILNYFHSVLSKYPEAREEYEDGSFPVYKSKGSRKRPKSINISKKINNLVKSYVKDHDLQWGEVIYIVYGYLMIHRPSDELKLFYYGSKL